MTKQTTPATPLPKWTITNGVIEMDVCNVCAQPYYEGHIDCTCPKNHPENCNRPTYEKLANLAPKLAEALRELIGIIETGEVDGDLSAYAYIGTEALAQWEQEC